jgi:hypothetical protein
VADYTALFLPGQRITLQASGPITGADPVIVSGTGTVAKAATLADAKYVGIAGHDAVSGQKLTVICSGVVHESIADGTVTAGDQVTTTNTANRQVKTLATTAVDVTGTPTQTTINTAINTSIANARAVIGVALTTAADNALVRWMSE